MRHASIAAAVVLVAGTAALAQSGQQGRQQRQGQQQGQQQRQAAQQRGQQADGPSWLYFDNLPGPDYLIIGGQPQQQQARSQRRQGQNQRQQAQGQQAQGQQAQGQQAQGQQAQGPQAQGQGQQGRDRQIRPLQVQGTVQRARLVQFRGAPQRHVVAEVMLDTGRRLTVDLGTPQDLGNRKLTAGQRLNITGRVGRIDDRFALFAQKVQTNGQSFVIDRASQRRMRETRGQGQQIAGRRQSGPARQVSQGQTPRIQNRTVRGTIADRRDLSLRGQQDQHALVKLQTTAGPILVVDLGPRNKLQGVDLSKGKRISVTGSAGRVNAKPVLVARRVRVDGQALAIDRPRQSDPGAPTQASGRQQGRQQQGRQQQGRQQQGRQQQGRQQQGSDDSSGDGTSRQ